MPIGIVSEEMFREEVRERAPLGRNGKKEVPHEIRALAASEVISGAKLNDVARELGISPQSVSAYKNGATSLATYNKPDEKLKKANDEVKESIKGVALSKMMEAMNAISEANLKLSKPNVASAVARDMSTIVKNMSPNEDGINVDKAVIIYKSPMKEEADYPVIDVQQGE